MTGNLHFAEVLQTALSHFFEKIRVKKLVSLLATLVAIDDRFKVHH